MVHLARAGWIRWYERLPATRIRPAGRGPLALRIGFTDRAQATGPGIDIPEGGTDKRLRLWVVRDLSEVEPIGRLGRDALDPTSSTTDLTELLGATSSTLKTALTDQALLSGIGNTYSDEVLHKAALSPFKAAARLRPDEIHRLHQAMMSVLGAAVAGALGQPPHLLKDDKRTKFQVHGRTGQPCPVWRRMTHPCENPNRLGLAGHPLGRPL